MKKMRSHTGVYETTISLGRGSTQIDVALHYEYEPYDLGVRYYPDGSGCPPTPASVNIYDIKIVSGWFDVGDGYEVDKQWFIDRGWLEYVTRWLFKHIEENPEWYEEEILHDIDDRDNEPDHPMEY